MLRYLDDVVTLELDVDKCNGCGMCRIVCPQGVFALENKRAAIIDRDACMECGACAQNCESGALEVRSGVGCAAGVIVGKLTGSETACCGPSDDDGPACCV